MAFTHTTPRLVRTPMIIPTHWVLKPLMSGLVYPFSLSMDESAEYHLHALLVGENGSFRRGPTSEILDKGKGYFSTEEAKKRLWEHTLEVTTIV